MSNREKLINVLINLSNDDLSYLIRYGMDRCKNNCPAYDFCNIKHRELTCNETIKLWLESDIEE